VDTLPLVRPADVESKEGGLRIMQD
jgi:hypothetical protein